MSDQPPESETILETAQNDPEAVDVEKVVALLDHHEGDARNVALMTLNIVASHDPDLVVDHADPLIDALNDGYMVAESTAARVLARISEEYPETVRPAIPRLVEMLDEDPPLRRYRAGRALVPLLNHAPEDFLPVADDLVDVLVDPPNAGLPTPDDWDSMSEEEREQMKDVLEEREDEAKKDIARSFGVREFIANALVEVADREPERVSDRVDEIAEWLDDGPPVVRAPTIDVVRNVAQYDQSAAEPAIDKLIEVAQNDIRTTRVHAIQALGYAGATEAIEPLREIAANDDDPELNDEVRDLAAETADFLENGA